MNRIDEQYPLEHENKKFSLELSILSEEIHAKNLALETLLKRKTHLPIVIFFSS
jgi:hypothetical protein